MMIAALLEGIEDRRTDEDAAEGNSQNRPLVRNYVSAQSILLQNFKEIFLSRFDIAQIILIFGEWNRYILELSMA